LSEPTVFLVDDEPEFRRSLGRLLRSQGLASREFSSGREFLDTFDPCAPGCLVLDLAMPGVDGIELQRILHEERDCEIPIIFLSGHAEVPDSVAALKEGALDFLTKPVEPVVLLASVHRALERDAELRRQRVEREDLERRFDTLTPREREVMAHVVTGQLNKQIARDLGTAEKTIRIHRGRVMQKMQADSLASLVRMAERLGI
jgi:FixJ family two-component response regulator